MFYGPGPDDQWSVAGRRIEEAVFCHSLGYTPELVRAEYSPYDDVSVWIVLANMHEGVVVGAVRALICDLEGLKLAADMRQWWGVELTSSLMTHGVEVTSGIVECATISVLPEWRRTDRHWAVRALCAAFGLLTLDVGGAWCVQLQDVSGPRLLKRLLGLPFEVICGLEPVDFLGPVVPTVSHVARHYELFAPKTDKDFVALYAGRNTSVRNGTILPTIDLTDTRLPRLRPPEAENSRPSGGRTGEAQLHDI